MNKTNPDEPNQPVAPVPTVSLSYPAGLFSCCAHSRTIEVLACHNSLYPACLDRYGGRGAVAPGPFLVTECDRRGTSTRAEKVFGERLDNGRVIALAAENVEVGVVRIVRKMAADQRGRDQLHHGIAGDAA